MKRALEQAHFSKEMKEVPVGCVFVDQNHITEGDAAIVCKSHNLTNLSKNVLKHSEVGYKSLRDSLHPKTEAIWC